MFNFFKVYMTQSIMSQILFGFIHKINFILSFINKGFIIFNLNKPSLTYPFPMKVLFLVIPTLLQSSIILYPL